MFQKKLKMMKKNRMKINDVYADSVFGDTDTFFYLMANDTTNYPLVEDFINTLHLVMLDADYFGGHSADKYVSPLFQKTYDFTRDAESPFNALNSRLAQIIYNRFAVKWKKIYDALMTEYNPLENYSMEEIRTPDLTTDETQNEKTDVTTERETSATNSYKGFNADDPVEVNKTDGDETTTTTGAKADNEISKKIEQTGTETLTRSGNIGVTTSQQMLESEFKVRQYDFYKMVYNDIDSVLCLSIY